MDGFKQVFFGCLITLNSLESFANFVYNNITYKTIPNFISVVISICRINKCGKCRMQLLVPQ